MQIILEVAIGLVLTIAVMAVIVSSTMELISAVTRMRARALEDGIGRLLDDRQSLPTRWFGWLGLRTPSATTTATQVVLAHPLIKSLSSPRATNRPPSYIDAVTFASVVLGSSFPTASLIVKVLDGQGLDNRIRSLSSNGPADALKAAWSSAEGNALTLVETLLADRTNGQAAVALILDPSVIASRVTTLTTDGDPSAVVLAAAWQAAGNSLPRFISELERNDLVTLGKKGAGAVAAGLAQIKAVNHHFGASLESLWDRAGSDLSNFRKEVEDWFDREMARVSGWYSRWAQWIMILVALVLVIALNVSAVTVGKALWADPTLRAKAADAAAHVVSPSTTTATETAPTATTVAQAPHADSQTLEGIGLPIGWNATAWPGLDWYLVLHFLGLVMVAIAASFGAPFWFDLLNRLVNLRAGGKPPPTAADQRAAHTV